MRAAFRGAIAKSPKGFTLIETLAVMVILSVLALGFASFIKAASEGYEAVRERSLAAQRASVFAEMFRGELSRARPGSVRVAQSGNASYLEFVSVEDALLSEPVTYACDPARGELRRHWGYKPQERQPVEASSTLKGAKNALALNGVDSCSFVLAPIADHATLALLRMSLKTAGGSINFQFQALASPPWIEQRSLS